MEYILWVIIFNIFAFWGIVWILNLHRKCILELNAYVANLEKVIVKVGRKVGYTEKDL